MTGTRTLHGMILVLLALAPAAVRAQGLAPVGANSRAKAGMQLFSNDFGAALSNPAALGLDGRSGLGFSLVGALSSLKPSPGSEFNSGGEFGFVLSRGSRVLSPVLSAAVSIPLADAYSLTMPARDAFVWPQFGGGDRGLQAAVALSGRLTRSLSAGLAVVYTPSVTGNVMLDLQDPQGENDVDVVVKSGVVPVAGLLYEINPQLQLALGYFHGARTSLDMPVRALASSIDIHAVVRGTMSQSPRSVALGVRLSPSPDSEYEAELVWRFWSLMDYPSPLISLLDTAGGDSLGMKRSDPGFKDSLVARVGAEQQLSGRLRLLGGAAYESPACRKATGESNVLCDSLLRASAGLSWVPEFLAVSGGGKLALQLAANLAFVLPSRVDKQVFVPENPGFPSFEYSAYRLDASVGVEYRFK